MVCCRHIIVNTVHKGDDGDDDDDDGDDDDDNNNNSRRQRDCGLEILLSKRDFSEDC